MKPTRKPRRRDVQRERRLEQARNIETFVRMTREEMNQMFSDLEIVIDELRK
jgi:hypothetical protein